LKGFGLGALPAGAFFAFDFLGDFFALAGFLTFALAFDLTGLALSPFFFLLAI
jgi:hypothetical protein